MNDPRSQPPPLRLALLFNILAPYRVPLFSSLAQTLDVLLILSGDEDNRKWEHSAELGFKKKVAFGWTFKSKSIGSRGRIAEQKYFHVNPGYSWELWRFRPQAIVSAEMGVRSILAVIYGWLFRVPVWIWWEGGAHSARMQSSSRLRVLLRRYFFALSVRQWFSFGADSTSYLQSIGVHAERIRQIQLPVDERMFGELGDQFPLETPHPRALFVGRLIENKGIYQLLEAASELQGEGVESSLIIVGNGPERERVQHESRRLGLLHVEMIDWVPSDRMPSMYRACDFLVFPTFDDVWGLVVNEAILSNLPVIASKFAGCAEELLPGDAIFDPHDPDSIRDAYKRALMGSVPRQDKAILQSIRVVANVVRRDIELTLKSRKAIDCN